MIKTWIEMVKWKQEGGREGKQWLQWGDTVYNV